MNEFWNTPDDCREIHRNFCKMKGKTDQDRIKKAGIKTGTFEGL